MPICVLVNPKHPAKTFGELVSWAKAQQEPVLFATAGAGSMPHLWFSYVANKLGFPVKHVGYRGAAPALLDLIAGNVNLLMDTYNPGCMRQATGEVRALGYAWDKRLAVQPDVPTLKEQGFDLPPAAATFVTEGNARGYRRQTQHGVQQGADRSHRARGAREEQPASGGTPAKYKAFLADQIATWTRVAKDNHIEAEQ